MILKNQFIVTKHDDHPTRATNSSTYTKGNLPAPLKSIHNSSKRIQLSFQSGCISLTDQILVSFLSSPSMKRQLNFFLRGLDRVILQQLTRHITYIAINNTYTPAVKVPSTSHWIN